MVGKQLIELDFKASSMMFYEDRLNTFDMWPSQIQPSKFQLSSAGFFYTGRNDTVECFSCALRLHQWKKEDNPLTEHRFYSPSCLFLKIIGQSKISSTGDITPWTPWKTFDPQPLFQYGDFHHGGIDKSFFQNGGRDEVG